MDTYVSPFFVFLNEGPTVPVRDAPCKPQKTFNSSRILSLCLTRFLKGKIRGNENISAAKSWFPPQDGKSRSSRKKQEFLPKGSSRYIGLRWFMQKKRPWRRQGHSHPLPVYHKGLERNSSQYHLQRFQVSLKPKAPHIVPNSHAYPRFNKHGSGSGVVHPAFGLRKVVFPGGHDIHIAMIVSWSV